MQLLLLIFHDRVIEICIAIVDRALLNQCCNLLVVDIRNDFIEIFFSFSRLLNSSKRKYRKTISSLSMFEGELNITGRDSFPSLDATEYVFWHPTLFCIKPFKKKLKYILT